MQFRYYLVTMVRSLGSIQLCLVYTDNAVTWWLCLVVFHCRQRPRRSEWDAGQDAMASCGPKSSSVHHV